MPWAEPGHASVWKHQLQHVVQGHKENPRESSSLTSETNGSPSDAATNDTVLPV